MVCSVPSVMFVLTLWMRVARMAVLPSMVPIPAGTFVIGTSGKVNGTADKLPIARSWYGGDYDEHPLKNVTIASPFFMSTTEVTNAMYEEFDPSHRALRGFKGFSIGDNEAAVFISYRNASAFCEWLNNQQQEPNTTRLRYRLPTEAEWEFATRGGSTSNFWYGDDFNVSEGKGNANRPEAEGVSSVSAAAAINLTVGEFRSSPYGLYDCHGNVEEWTSTPYELYDGRSAVGVVNSVGVRVTRGGSHSTAPYYLRSSNRAAAMETQRSEVLGFRVAADPEGGARSTTTLVRALRRMCQQNLRRCSMALSNTCVSVTRTTWKPSACLRTTITHQAWGCWGKTPNSL